MSGLNETILTWILLVPARRGRADRSAARSRQAVRLDRAPHRPVTFGLTLHLPAHFVVGQPGFQFEVNKPWIDNPAIFYHVGVDGLSLWMVVLTGLLAPVGVLASWNAISERRKVFYSLFLVQQTAMFGVFVSLDLMVYYGFWELSLVPMAILIAMYGRKDGRQGRRQVLPLHLHSLGAAAGRHHLALRPHRHLQLQPAPDARSPQRHSLPARALLDGTRFPLRLRRQGARSSRCMAGWPIASAKPPSRMAMVIAGKLGLYSMLRFHVALFPVQARAIAPLLIALTVIGVLYGACLALVQRDFWRLIAFATLSHFSLTTLGIYGLTLTGRDGAIYQTLNEGVIEGALFVLLGVLDTRYATSQIASLRRSRRQAPAHRNILRHHHSRHGRTTHAQWLRWRVPDPLQHLHRSQPRLGHRRHRQHHPWRRLRAVAGAAPLLWPAERDDRCATGDRSALQRTGRACTLAVLMLVMGLAPDSGCAPSIRAPGPVFPRYPQPVRSAIDTTALPPCAQQTPNSICQLTRTRAANAAVHSGSATTTRQAFSCEQADDRGPHDES